MLACEDFNPLPDENPLSRGRLPHAKGKGLRRSGLLKGDSRDYRLIDYDQLLNIYRDFQALTQVKVLAREVPKVSLVKFFLMCFINLME
jgi:hypothetical protein